MRDGLYMAGAALAVFLVVGAAYWAGGVVRQYLNVDYVSLACVDAFSRQSFQTDNNVVRVEAWPEAYAITNRDGTLTLVPRSENLVCSLSREYLPNATQPTP